MLQLWTIANILKLPYSLRKKITFYAPLIDSLDFMGIDPVTFARASIVTRLGRDGFTHDVAVNVPRFNYNVSNLEVGWGMALTADETFAFASENVLSNSNSLIWFEDRVALSTPTVGNPFNDSGVWVGNRNKHLSHICKADAILSVSEINTIQAALLDVPPQVIAVPPPPVSDIGTFVSETPSGGTGTVFTLSQNPNLDSLIVTWSGLFLKRVASSPAELQYTAGSTGNRTLTLGSTVVAGQSVNADYVVA